MAEELVAESGGPLESAKEIVLGAEDPSMTANGSSFVVPSF